MNPNHDELGKFTSGTSAAGHNSDVGRRGLVESVKRHFAKMRDPSASSFRVRSTKFGRLVGDPEGTGRSLGAAIADRASRYYGAK